MVDGLCGCAICRVLSIYFLLFKIILPSSPFSATRAGWRQRTSSIVPNQVGQPVGSAVSQSRAGCTQNVSIIVEPDVGVAPVFRMINGAKKSIDLVMYEFGDDEIESALAAAEKRGVAVRVILDGGYQDVPQSKKTLRQITSLPIAASPSTGRRAILTDARKIARRRWPMSSGGGAGIAAAGPGRALIMSFQYLVRRNTTQPIAILVLSIATRAMLWQWKSKFDVDWNGMGRRWRNRWLWRGRGHWRRAEFGVLTPAPGLSSSHCKRQNIARRL